MSKNPMNHVGVYCCDLVEIEASICDVSINPVVIRIGDKYATNATNLYLSAANAEQLYAKLGAALQDLQRQAHPETEQEPVEQLSRKDDVRYQMIGGEGPASQCDKPNSSPCLLIKGHSGPCAPAVEVLTTADDGDMPF